MLKNVSLIFLMIVATATIALSQLRTPAASPSATFTQTVGLTEVAIEYSRPGVKGRTIFGDLVPYGKIWRTGANSATKISFSQDVTVEGKELKAGSYAILTKPGKTMWDVSFYPYDSGNWGSYVEKEPAATVTVASAVLPLNLENFTMMIHNLENQGADLHLVWANTLVVVKIDVNSDAQVMADIERTLAGPTADQYYAIGSYMHDSGKDLKEALKYVQKATKGGEPRFWQVRKEALILADLGRKAEAIVAANLSLKLAKEAGNDDYVRMNEKSIKAWSM